MDWPAGWFPVDAAQRVRLDEELRRELKPGHRLYGLPLTVVARCRECDDYLAMVAGTDTVAEVHLTWAGDYEKPPRPTAKVYASMAAWHRAVLDSGRRDGPGTAGPNDSPEGAQAP